MPYGTNPQTVKRDLASIEEYLTSRPEITAVTTSLGGTPSRYNLVRTVAEPALSYGELIVDFTSPETLKSNIDSLQVYLSEHYPAAYVRMKQYNLMYMDCLLYTSVRVNVNGAYKEIEDIRNLLIKGHEQDQIRLSDVARVTKGYVKPEREGLLLSLIHI